MKLGAPPKMRGFLFVSWAKQPRTVSSPRGAALPEHLGAALGEGEGGGLAR